LITRIISGVVLLPLLFFFLIKGGYWLQGAVIFFSMIGLYEFYRAFSQKKMNLAHIIGFAFSAFFLVFAEFIINESNIFNIFVSVFLVFLLVYMVAFHKVSDVKDILITFFGFFYVPFLMSHIFMVRNYVYGEYFVWLIFITAFGCDTGAYFTGMLFGKHKLIPELSPKKTIEGAIGGVIVATAISLLYGLYIDNHFVTDWVDTPNLCVLTGIIGSILSQFGDLAASTLKRYVGLKDYGHLIPGHGGMLDRFDSVLLTAPVVYYVMLFTIEIM